MWAVRVHSGYGSMSEAVDGESIRVVSTKKDAEELVEKLNKALYLRPGNEYWAVYEELPDVSTEAVDFVVKSVLEEVLDAEDLEELREIQTSKEHLPPTTFAEDRATEYADWLKTFLG